MAPRQTLCPMRAGKDFIEDPKPNRVKVLTAYVDHSLTNWMATLPGENLIGI